MTDWQTDGYIERERVRIANALEALTDHHVSGYEWDCACVFPESGGFHPEAGETCPHNSYPHQKVVALDEVLAIVRDER